jgi:hypothetical protein
MCALPSISGIGPELGIDGVVGVRCDHLAECTTEFRREMRALPSACVDYAALSAH